MSSYPPQTPGEQPPYQGPPAGQPHPPPPGQQYPPPGQQQYPPPPPGQQYPPPGQQQYPPPPPGQQYPPPGQQQYPPPPGAPPPRRRLAAVLSSNLVRVLAVLVIVAAVVVAIVLSGGGASNTTTTLSAGGPSSAAPQARHFSVGFPSSWSAVPSNQLAAYPGSPVAVLLRSNRTGLIVITQARSNPSLSLAAIGPSLAKRITTRFPDARTVTSKIVTVRAGKAYYYSFVRSKAGTVNGVLVVPGGPVTYQLNSVTPGNQPQAAKEIGQIFLSFNLV